MRGLDAGYASVPEDLDRPVGDAALEIGKNPRLGGVVESRAEMQERHASTAPPEVESGLDRRVRATDHHGITLQGLVPLVIEMSDVRQVLAGHAKEVGIAEVTRRDDQRACVGCDWISAARARVHDERPVRTLDTLHRLVLPDLQREVRYRGAVVRQRVAAGGLVPGDRERESSDLEPFGG